MRHENDDKGPVKFGEIIFLEKEMCLQFTCDYCEIKMNSFELFINHALSHIYDQNNKPEISQILQKLFNETKVRTHCTDDTRHLENIEQPLANVVLEYPTRKSGGLKIEEINMIDIFNERCDKDDDFSNKVPEFELLKCVDENDQTHSSENEEAPIEIPSNISSAVLQRRAILLPFICIQCSKQFTTKSSLKRHMITHSDEKRFKCEICNSSFKDKSNFNVHRKRHLQMKPHQCEDCEKRFATTTELYTHKRTHTGEKPFVCETCGNCFNNSSTFNNHKLRHKNLRRHMCKICAKGFYTKTMLKDHMVSHSSEKPFKCEKCGTAFKSKKSLGQHSKLHSNLYEYKCQYCEKAFQQCAGLHSHVKSVHRNTK